jgi:hypothetical protein
VRNTSVSRKQSLLLQLEFLFIGFSTKFSSTPCMLSAFLVQLHFIALIIFDEEYESSPQATLSVSTVLDFYTLVLMAYENQGTAVCQLHTNCALSVNTLTSVS